ncbi:hypothetical protein Zmor_019851 [Zophobas morio]|uniref:Ricin B lectin domain-containing protein n=2 Tax=Zophobas morio TaxID=2755281 RepID=A0AA38I2X7_9CUCU|nr:hypothetical protein Zmor_019851 [Zophobas morio]
MCTSTVSAACDCSKEDELYSIRGIASGLVLDASKPDQIQIQRYTGVPAQLWRFERGTHAGLFRIVNHATGTALSYKDYKDGWYILTVKKASKQEFMININNTITNVETTWNMDVLDNKLRPGTLVGLYVTNGNRAQLFKLQEKYTYTT